MGTYNQIRLLLENMETQHHNSQQSTKNIHPHTTQMPAHAAQRRGRLEKQTLSITPTFFNNKFQQGCETDRRNVARDEIKQEPWTSKKATSELDPDIIEISYHPYINQKEQKRTLKPIEYIDISSPFPPKTTQTKQKMKK